MMIRPGLQCPTGKPQHGDSKQEKQKAAAAPHTADSSENGLLHHRRELQETGLFLLLVSKVRHYGIIECGVD
ncbi:hypothetical protein NDU88_002827 [Pleurodeles waltl]|uniref:Uncharacterized protein n=1 Tax=Pleurodeles waltl TaxID=8319 RepID=A0AAV7UZM0_PLEWA|nr:hypothetical protein NDU88_002827 [Pleurodeles waltl]